MQKLLGMADWVPREGLGPKNYLGPSKIYEAKIFEYKNIS